MANEFVKSITSLTRGEYDRKKEAWERNERRFNAGEDVYDELRKFNWEKENNAAYKERKERAVWPEFSQLVVEKFVGILFQNFPEIDFGRLETAEGGTRAQMLQENADGTGADARSLWGFWFDVMAHAMATKHRWILAEAPAQAPATVADEENGLRPYFVEYSPTQVPYWRFNRGTLQCARIEYTETRLVASGGKVKEEEVTIHYLMTKEGFTGWGDLKTTQAVGAPDFALGGWWQVDEEGEVIEREGEPMQGDWSNTDGKIPLTRLYYERGSRDSERTGITNLGRLEVNFMDQFSAMMNHAWESGSGATAFTNVNLKQWNTIRDAGQMNAKWFGVPGSENGGDVGVESVVGGEEPAAIIAALAQIMELAMKVIARELTTSPEASGRSRQVQHLKGNSPRLVNMAGNVEEAMNTAHRFLEMRWTGKEPTFGVTWTRQFDLRSITEQVKGVFEVFKLVDAQAPTLFASMLMQLAEKEGLLPEGEEGDEGEGIQEEIRDSLSLGIEQQAVTVERVRESIEADRTRRLDADGAAARRQAIEEAAANGQG